jgi:hypothetical protein
MNNIKATKSNGSKSQQNNKVNIPKKGNVKQQVMKAPRGVEGIINPLALRLRV